MSEAVKRPAEDSYKARQCEYIVPKKGRRCRMLSKKGNKFCGEHLIFDPNNRDRIQCPNDNRHTVLKSDLDEHLKKCNSRILDDPWITKYLNQKRKPDKAGEFRRPNELEVAEMIPKVLEIYEKIKDEFVEFKPSEFASEEMKKLSEGGKEKKRMHLVQLNSIIASLHKFGLLQRTEDECLIDLGSGKAQLVYWASKLSPKTKYLLVDRMGARNKFDRRAVHEDPSLKIERLRCSIEHLDLTKVPMVVQATQVTAVCKHFCGAATDYGIRCLENGLRDGAVQLAGFALAPCCHHRCELEEFVGVDFLKENDIEGEAHFSALRHISTWACCGFEKQNDHDHAGSDDKNLFTGPNADKLELGRKAKRILEFGRAKYLKTLGFDVKLVQYVDYEISPENILIVGTRKIK